METMINSEKKSPWVFFKNEEIFVQLLDEMITHAWKALNYSLTQAQKTF